MNQDINQFKFAKNNAEETANKRNLPISSFVSLRWYAFFILSRKEWFTPNRTPKGERVPLCELVAMFKQTRLNKSSSVKISWANLAMMASLFFNSFRGCFSRCSKFETEVGKSNMLDEALKKKPSDFIKKLKNKIKPRKSKFFYLYYLK